MDGAAEMETAHYRRMAQIGTASETAPRFFGPFNFMSAAQVARLMCYALLLSGLSSRPSCGMGCASGMVMLEKSENMNAQKDSLPIVTGLNFKEEVLESKRPVLVEFWAPWSQPCHVFDRVLQELANACAGTVKVVKVNADDSLDLSLWYDIQSVPTLLYFMGGDPRARVVGTASKEAILAKLKLLSH